MKAIILGIFGGAAISLGACNNEASWTQLASVADHFVASVKAQDSGAVRSQLDRGLQARLAPGQLEGFLGMTGLAEAESVAWKSGTLEGERGKLYGEYRRAGSDLATPLRLDLLQEGKAWRIQGIQRGVRVLEPEPRDYFVPYDADALRLATETTVRFGQAVAKGDLAAFWAASPEAFRRRFDQEAFLRAFAGFVEQGVNLLPAAKVSPLFDSAPTLTPEGILRVSGHFPTRPSRVDFGFEFLPEQGGWVLAGMRLAVVPEPGR